MRVKEAKSLAPICIEDKDGDFWVLSKKEIGKKKKRSTEYELAETPEEFWQFFEHGSDDTVTYRHIDREYGIRKEFWNVKLAVQELSNRWEDLNQ